MGPTATGKTALAVELAERLPCEIISVDSAMVYRGLDIGTAKPDAAVRARAPHRLIDIRDPSDPYSAAGFRQDALCEMADIAARGKIPLLVGGTMLYFKALEQGLAQLPGADTNTRTWISQQAELHGWPELHRLLEAVDPAAARRIHPHDPQRIQRALEVYYLSGRALTSLQSQVQDPGHSYRFVKFAMIPADRAELHRRIERRFRSMVAQGFLDEVRGLWRRRDLHSGLPAMRAVGYRQFWEHLEGKMSYQEATERAIYATRQYAKRQLTWLRSQTALRLLPVESGRQFEKVRQAIETK